MAQKPAEGKARRVQPGGAINIGSLSLTTRSLSAIAPSEAGVDAYQGKNPSATICGEYGSSHPIRPKLTRRQCDEHQVDS